MSGDEATPREVAAGLEELRTTHAEYSETNAARIQLRAQRSRLLMDLYVLHQITQQGLVDSLAGATDVSRHAMVEWMRKYGPREYVAVRPAGKRFEIQTLTLPTRSDGWLLLENSQRLIQAALNDGWRVAPSAWQVTTAEVDPAELWARLEP